MVVPWVGVAALATAADAARLTVDVVGLRSDAGQVLVALYDSPAGFPGTGASAIGAERSAIAAGKASVIFEDVPPGTYAIALIHDENRNGTLDRGFLGIPKEGVGASNDAQGRVGAPRFDRARFELETDTIITLRVVYPYPF
jgi:uncharacterized protein (DUF2141 family)